MGQQVKANDMIKKADDSKMKGKQIRKRQISMSDKAMNAVTHIHDLHSR